MSGSNLVVVLVMDGEFGEALACELAPATAADMRKQGERAFAVTGLFGVFFLLYLRKKLRLLFGIDFCLFEPHTNCLDY